MGDDTARMFLRELQIRQAVRVQDLRAERIALSRQKLAVLTLAATTATVAVCLVTYGLARAVFKPSIDVSSLAELAGVGTGLASGGFSWLTNHLRDRQAELDAVGAHQSGQEHLVLCALLIADPLLRDKTAAEMATLAAASFYGPGSAEPVKRSPSPAVSS